MSQRMKYIASLLSEPREVELLVETLQAAAETHEPLRPGSARWPNCIVAQALRRIAGELCHHADPDARGLCPKCDALLDHHHVVTEFSRGDDTRIRVTRRYDEQGRTYTETSHCGDRGEPITTGPAIQDDEVEDISAAYARVAAFVKRSAA